MILYVSTGSCVSIRLQLCIRRDRNGTLSDGEVRRREREVVIGAERKAALLNAVGANAFAGNPGQCAGEGVIVDEGTELIL